MSQHDQVIANSDGATVRADINAALAALFGNSSGATEPTTKIAYMWWPDTATGWMKQRNAANSAWIQMYRLSDFAFLSSLFAVLDSTDDTKKLVLSLAGITTGTTRTLTVPNESGTLALDGTTRTQTCWIPAGAMVSRTTNGAAAGTVEATTNKNMFKTLDFDATTAEYAQFSINMPKGWDEGTITAVFVWSHAATTTNFGVAWELAGVAVSDDDAMDVAFGTAGTVTDTGGTTNDCYITAASGAITIAGTPATNDLVMFQVNRAPANGSDTMAIDARLHGVRLMYSINTLTDA